MTAVQVMKKTTLSATQAARTMTERTILAEVQNRFWGSDQASSAHQPLRRAGTPPLHRGSKVRVSKQLEVVLGMFETNLAHEHDAFIG